MRVPSVLALATVALFASPQAEAKWEYTRWGVSPAQVAASSGGKVAVLPAAQQRKVPFAGMVHAAAGGFVEDGIPLTVNFSFEDKPGGGLVMVGYAVDDAVRNNAFKAALVRKLASRQAVPACPPSAWSN